MQIFFNVRSFSDFLAKITVISPAALSDHRIAVHGRIQSVRIAGIVFKRKASRYAQRTSMSASFAGATVFDHPVQKIAPDSHKNTRNLYASGMRS